MDILKPFQSSETAVTAIIETVIATAIVFAVIGLFYFSLNTIYDVHIQSDIDLKAKCYDALEVFLSSPGLSSSLRMDWQKQDETISRIGLATSPMISYGTFEDETTFNEPIFSLLQEGYRGEIVTACFLAGTQVVTPDGSTVSIEDITIGDMIYSWNPTSQTYEPGQVVKTFHHSPNEMTEYFLILNNHLCVTPNHLFFENGSWRSFGELVEGDTLNGHIISSIERIYEKVPTYDLCVEPYHNYLISFHENTIIAHNDDPVLDSSLWLPASKIPYIGNVEFPNLESFARNYYISYTYFDTGDHDRGGIYEIRGETNMKYPVLDATKIDALKLLDYSDVKNAIGFSDGSLFGIYDFSINISSNSYDAYTYGAGYDFTSAVVTITRSVLIYHPPYYDQDADPPPADFSAFTAPFYEDGLVTFSLFKGGREP